MQNTSHAVMAQRVEPHDSLDYFPTPPWATRALCEWLGPLTDQTCWEPACGEGHMARALAEHFGKVRSSDVHDYGIAPDSHGCPFVYDFLFFGQSPIINPGWVITNPPFRLAAEFVHRGLAVATNGVAMLCRSVFLEGGERWRTLYSPTPPSDVLVFCERVPMLKGRLDKAASSATSYAWFVWRKSAPCGTHLHWLPPGTRKQLERPGDYDSYDGLKDGHDGYLEALKEIRRRKIQSGEIEPLPQEREAGE